MSTRKEKGFAIIGLILAIAIIAIVAISLLAKDDNNQKKSLPEVKKQAEVDTNKINQDLQNYQEQIDIQDN